MKCQKCGSEKVNISMVAKELTTLTTKSAFHTDVSSTIPKNKKIAICQNCGNSWEIKEYKEIDKATDFILCFFFGIFGAHKFYECKPGMGLLYLFTLGLFCIGWIVDLINIAMKPKRYLVVKN